MPPAAKSIHRRPGPCLHSLRTSLTVASFLGVVPYSVRGHKVVFGDWQLPFHVFCVFILHFLGCYGFITLSTELPIFITSMILLQYIPYSVSTISFLAFQIACRADIQNIILLMLKVEKRLAMVNAESDIRYNYVHGIVFPVFIMCCGAGHLISDGSWKIPRVAMILTFYIGNLHFVAMKALVLTFVNIVHYYLDFLIRSASSWDVLLIRLCEIQDRLADVTQCIQKVYGLPMLFISLCSFTNINTNVFIAGKLIRTPKGLIFITWTLVASGMMFWPFNTCQRMKDKADEFYLMLYRIMKKDKTCKLINNDRLRGHLLKRRSFGINAGGFGDVDLEYFSRMVSATVTYSVILIQAGRNLT